MQKDKSFQFCVLGKIIFVGKADYWCILEAFGVLNKKEFGNYIRIDRFEDILEYELNAVGDFNVEILLRILRSKKEILWKN